VLHVSNISKSYGADTILSDISFVLNTGERVGLVGPNGCGKTTLLHIITGREQPDSGRVRFSPPELEVGYLAQALVFDEGESVNEVLARATREHSRAWANMQHYAELMSMTSGEADLPALTGAYAEAEARFEAAGGYAVEARLEAILTGLGLADVPRHQQVEHLSGGEKTRLGLAGLLVRQPKLLLLDEPTNHLDIDALAWLEDWLRGYAGGILIVSHDRTFLDAITTRTLVSDPKTHTLRDFAGNYSAYTATVAHEVEQQWQAYRDQLEEIGRLKQAAQHLRGQAKFKKGGKADTPDKFAKGFFANRSAATIGRAKQIERRLERLQNQDRIERPGHQWQLKLDFTNDDSGARRVLSLEGVAMSFDEDTLFRDVTLTLIHRQRIALIGANGTGKTTLLRMINGELAPTAGHIHLGAGVKLGYVSQEQKILDPDSTPYDAIRAAAEDMDQTEARSFLHFFLFSGDDVFIKIKSLSFGERARLMLALLVVQGCNFLLLDEPLNHLDLPSRERFEQALSQFPGTMLAVVHDRTFIQRIATGIWEIKEGRIRDLPVLDGIHW
jgi:ATP-binding cassette subfamily F protein 3